MALRTSAALTTVAVCMATCSAPGGVVFSTIGEADDAYDHAFAYFVGTVTPSTIEFGFRFVPSASGPLTQLRAALYQTGPARPIRLSLYADTGPIPGTLIGYVDAVPPRNVGGAVWILPLDGSMQVEAGQRYFLTARSPTTPQSSFQWHVAGTSTMRFPGAQIYRERSTTPWVLYSSSELAAFELSITRPPACVADVDDGSRTGTPDGGVTIDDLLYYLFQFEGGEAAADLDDGTGTGTPDGGVTIEDLLYYLIRFEHGC